MEVKNISSFHILFFDGAHRLGKPIDTQIKKLFPELEVQIIPLTEKEILLTPHQENILVVAYSLGVRKAIDWANKNAFTGPMYLLDPECWKPSKAYTWATQSKLGLFVFSLVVKFPRILNLISWMLPTRIRKYVQLFVRNKEFRKQLYQDWLAAAQFSILPLEDLGAMKSQLTVVTSGEAIFMRYIPLKNIQQQGVRLLSMTDCSHSQLWKHFLKERFNPNENFL